MKRIDSFQDTYTLSNGMEFPCMGFGTSRTDKNKLEEAILNAIRVGFRLIDCAQGYHNEEIVGRAVRHAEIKREEIMVSSKLFNPDQGYDSTLRSFEGSLKRMGLDYLDLFLIHGPVPGGREHEYKELNKATWKAFERLYEEGMVRAIGVSNFLPHHLKHLMEGDLRILPMVNQIECHPYLPQDDLVAYCKKLGILVEAWSPLMQGAAFREPAYQYLAQKHSKSVAQIGLRWHVQKGIVPLPKASSFAHIKGNTEVFDFELEPIDMLLLDSLRTHGKTTDYWPDDNLLA